MIPKIVLSFFLFFLVFNSFSQEHNHTHEHSHEVEHNHAHEIGISAGPVYFLSAQEFSFATHFHYVYNFPETKFGLGVGYERIYDEHKHNFIGLEINYRPIHPITVSISPGITFEGEHRDESDFGLHFETVYEFELGAFHVGPMFELAYHPEDWHMSLGIHIGLGL